MTGAEARQRAAVVAEARSWLGTPYHHAAAVKGAGVDCAWLLIAVYRACSLVPPLTVQPYTIDWMLHRDEERYLATVQQHAREVATALPGDAAVWRFGRTYSHGAIVVDWPQVIHAYAPARVVCAGDATQGRLAAVPRKLFRLHAWADEP